MSSVIKRMAGPEYLTLNSTVAKGAGLVGWSDRSIALQFARPQDAKEYISKYHGHEMHMLEVVNAD